jgi:Uma2 family endonuclease
MATSTLRIGPADHGRAMTLQEFLDAEAGEGYRYELARGVLEVTEVPGEPHGLIFWFLIRSVGTYDLQHPGLIFRAGGGDSTQLLIPDLGSGRNPDVAVVMAGAPKDGRGRRVPALVMEIVSPGREARDRDYLAKREEYLAFGIREYWIVDRFARRVTVLIRDGDAWAERVFDGDATAEGLVLPGFAVRLADLWDAAARADAAEDDEEGEEPGAPGA